MLLNASKIVFHCWHVVASFLGLRPGRSWLLGKWWPRGVQKRRPHYLNCISSSPHHMCQCSVSIHIFGQTGTYYLNYSSGSPHYICQFSLFGLQCFFTHIWAEWKYLSRVPSVAPPMCQSALDYTGWFCAVKYLIAS